MSRPRGWRRYAGIPSAIKRYWNASTEWARRFVRDAWAGVPGDQVDFCGEPGAADEACDLARVFGAVGDAAEQNVFEGDALAGAERHAADGVDDRRDGPLAVDGHDLGADLRRWAR